MTPAPRIATLLVLASLISCQGPTPEYRSAAHDAAGRFAASAAARADSARRPRSAVKAPGPGSVEAGTKRRDREQELAGLIDPGSRADLAATDWLGHPTLETARRRVAVVRERFGQSRQLEELLLRYRRYLAPDREETPIMAPGVEAIRGRIDEAELAAAWAGLRETILARHAEITRERSGLGRLDEEFRITTDHLGILDDLIAVTGARTRTGRAKQADLLALRGERARLDASLAGIAARREAARARLDELTRSATPVAALVGAPEITLAPRAQLLSRALDANPGLGAARAELVRREQALRLADLNAAAAPGMPAQGVRAATRFEARERVAEQRARIAAREARLDRELATTLADLEAARRDLEALATQTVPDARAALSDTRTGFAGRSGTFLDVFESTRRLLGAELALVGARDRHLRALVDLQVLLGSTQP